MNKIFLTGGTGMLGTYVTSTLNDYGYEAIVADRSRFDLANHKAIYDYVKEARPDVILHFAAETDVDLCEREPARAGICNHLATEQIAKAAQACGAWLLYISSSNVFGAEGKISYNELDIPQPTNYYGRSKLNGEDAVRANCPDNHLILRAGWMIGGGPGKDHKFVGKIIQQIKDGATELKAVSDRLGSLTSAGQLSDFIIKAMANRQTGTYHFASHGTISRFDIARAIGEILKFKGSIMPVESSRFPLSAPRPFSEGIQSIYLPSLSESCIPGYWKDDLARYVASFQG
ncbi:SDR family oxidoreductase [Acerihabitans arboris]|uniref:dTDP-4-dehydrorhamnose reductase n=1 Tax=Acerihabitans arboris TaxID=2691583 RepID=A0A845SRT2_9GAMM|nr:SDR family oxidoreductase [Acerihabitans arboris]NDL65644.1 sugar nucleotide-binding protein [Acerihabitans arboris]